MDPHRFFGHRNSAYYFPPLNRPDTYFPPREIDDRIYRVRHESHYYLPVPNREFVDVPPPRRHIPPPYVESDERIYRTVRRGSPAPSPPPAPHRHHKSRKKSKKSKKRSRSKTARTSEYDEDSPYEYDGKRKDPELFNSLKNLSDEHDSFSDADFSSPLNDQDAQEHQQNNINTEVKEEVKPPNSNSQDAHRPTYQSYKLLHDPFLKPGCTKLYRYDGVVPNNLNYAAVQVRDPRSPLTKIWSRLEPLDLPVPQFKVSVLYFLIAFVYITNHGLIIKEKNFGRFDNCVACALNVLCLNARRQLENCTSVSHQLYKSC